MPNKKRYTAAEIAAMRLPGLPGTKARVIERAASEGWPFEERKGRGGTRRLYELPPTYSSQVIETSPVVEQPDVVVGAISSGRRADPARLSLAIRALEEFLVEEGLSIAPERKGDIVAVLYDYLERGAGNKELSSMLQIMR